MADLTTQWLGLTLKSPLILAASPLSSDLDAVIKAVNAGAGAVVMHSLFEEQITEEQLAVHRYFDTYTDTNAEARCFLPNADKFPLDSTPYLAQLDRLRQHVDVPIIASLNGMTSTGWITHAQELKAHGAAAIELNLYDIVTSPELSTNDIEMQQIETVCSVVKAVKIPVSVKISPFYSSVPAFAKQLEKAGAKGIVVFNRFYQPDVDLDALDVDRHIVLSTPQELPLRLHALAILKPICSLDLACTGGIHSGRDAAKALLCGAHVMQLASVLLQHGPERITLIRDELNAWLDEKGYSSSAQARGVLSMNSAENSRSWERLNYIRILNSWKK